MPPDPLEVSDATCLLHGITNHPVRFGGPIALYVNTQSLPCPPPDPPFVKRGESVFLSAEAEAGILEVKRLGGMDPYLFLSIPLVPGFDAIKHQKALAAYEPPPLCTPRWCGPSNTQLIWSPQRQSKGTGRLFTLRAPLNVRWATTCFTFYGDPWPSGGGHWLACRLLPRRRPAALRLLPTVLQLFVPLFDP